jgi:hypothetical protein
LFAVIGFLIFPVLPLESRNIAPLLSGALDPAALEIPTTLLFHQCFEREEFGRINYFAWAS